MECRRGRSAADIARGCCRPSAIFARYLESFALRRSQPADGVTRSSGSRSAPGKLSADQQFRRLVEVVGLGLIDVEVRLDAVDAFVEARERQVLQVVQPRQREVDDLAPGGPSRSVTVRLPVVPAARFCSRSVAGGRRRRAEFSDDDLRQRRRAGAVEQRPCWSGPRPSISAVEQPMSALSDSFASNSMRGIEHDEAPRRAGTASGCRAPWPLRRGRRRRLDQRLDAEVVGDAAVDQVDVLLERRRVIA